MQVYIKNTKVIDFFNNNPQLDIEDVLLSVLPLFDLIGPRNDKVDVSHIEKMLTDFSANQHTLLKLFEEKTEIMKLYIENKNNQLVHSLQNSDISKFSQIIHNHNIQLYDKLNSIQSHVESFNGMLNNSSKKGAFSENRVEAMLSSAFPNATIHSTHSLTASGDFIIEHHICNKILIENKEYKQNVPKNEIDKFLRDTEHQDCHGILMSQSSGVANKYNFQVDFVKGKVVVYLLHTHYDHQHLIDAVNIIQSVMHYASVDQTTSNDISLSSEQLNQFYKEYTEYKETNNSVISNLQAQIKILKNNNVPSFHNFLASRFNIVSQNQHICPRCNKECKSKAGLNSHMNTCVK